MFVFLIFPGPFCMQISNVIYPGGEQNVWRLASLSTRIGRGSLCARERGEGAVVMALDKSDLPLFFFFSSFRLIFLLVSSHQKLKKSPRYSWKGVSLV